MPPGILHDIANKYGLSPQHQSRQYCGCIDGQEEYNHFIDDLKSIGVMFSIDKTAYVKSGCIKFQLTSKTMNVEYDRSPIQVSNTRYLTCTQGGRYKKQAEPSVSNDRSFKKPRLRPNPTKKINCPAKMVVKCYTVFPQDQYKAKALTYQHGSREIRRIAKQLKKDIHSSSPPTGTMRFMIAMSPPEEHNHTTKSNQQCGILHPRLREEIHNFVHENWCSTKTMKAHLEEVVQEMFSDGDRPKPDKLNRSYYPNDQVIRFHMHKALYKVKLRKYDQTALEASIETWQKQSPNDKFKFRSYGVEANNEGDGEPAGPTLLFCHQTQWQQDLLARYGNNISILDAAYKATKYDLPLFFIVVKTNSDYCIVGTFVVSSESSTLIAEALSQFKAWNPEWEPKYFMTDYSEVEINALETTFPETTVYICAFHREQSWHRWLTKKGSVSKRAIAPLKKLWQDIAASHTEEEYAQSLDNLYDNKFLKCSLNAQRYFTREWLSVKHRWVSAYQDKDFVFMVNTNNGVESQKKIFEHSDLKQNKNSTLTGIIRMLIELYLPKMVSKYFEGNAMFDCDYNGYSADLPEFLKNRPISFSRHVRERYERAKEYESSHISYVGEGHFLVISELQSNDWYPVDFGAATCFCFDFKRWRFPCKHMCAIFIHTEWGFEQLPQDYREHPYLTLDTKYATAIALRALNEDEDLEADNTETFTVFSPPSPSPPPTEESEFDVRSARLQLQERLKRMTDYSYLNMTPENLKKVLDLSEQWERHMQSLVATSNEGLLLNPTEENPPKCTQGEKVKNIKRKYIALPRRIPQKNKNKCAGRAVALTDGRMLSTTTNLDFRPQTYQTVAVKFITNITAT